MASSMLAPRLAEIYILKLASPRTLFVNNGIYDPDMFFYQNVVV